MAEGVPKKNRKRHHSQMDNDADVPVKVQKVAAAKPPQPEVQSPPLSEPDGGPKEVKSKFRKFKFPKRPVHKSWASHISALLTNTLVNDALKTKSDPRHNIDMDAMDPVVMPSENVRRLWYYISREYPASFTLDDILTEINPLVKVTPSDIMNHETKLKYKDQIPKPPVTSYFQFVLSKQSKLKEKHPELAQIDVTRRLAMKWKEIGPERREKYIQRYDHLKKQYKTEIEEFYSEHPDARPHAEPRKSRRAKKEAAPKVNDCDSETEKRYKELKQLAPKPPVTAYFLFVNAKRGRYKDKHPNLKSSEITKKLADKWHALSSDRQAKYKQVYEDNHKEYKIKLEQFYSRYPDAKELFQSMRRPGTKRKKTTAITGTVSSTTGPVAILSSAKPSSSSSTVTHIAANSLQKHENKGKEKSEEDSSSHSSGESSSSSDSSDEEDTRKTTAVKTSAAKTTAVTSKAVPPRANYPVARKDIQSTKQEETSGSSSSSSEDSNSSSSSDEG